MVLTGLAVPDALVGEVARLVRLTARHAPSADDRNGRVLCDADLAVLGTMVGLPPRPSRRPNTASVPRRDLSRAGRRCWGIAGTAEGFHRAGASSC